MKLMRLVQKDAKVDAAPALPLAEVEEMPMPDEMVADLADAVDFHEAAEVFVRWRERFAVPAPFRVWMWLGARR